GAPDGVQWSSLAATVATVDSAGEVHAVGAGQARVVVVSKADATVADTVLVQVLPEQKVDSVRFKKAALDLFAGGAGEPLDATVHPPLANQEVLYSVKDPALARVESGLITGLKEGETVLIVKSAQDPSKADTVPVTVFPSEKVDSVRLAQDSVKLYLGGESQLLRASIHPATLQPRFLWRSADDKVVEVDAQGKVSPKGPGKAYVSATSRADGTKRDSTLVIVRKDVPQLSVGRDTIVSAGTTVIHRITVTQDYGLVTQFKADLNGDGIYEDSSATVPASRSFLYDGVKDYAVRFYVRDTEGNETVVTRLVKAVNGRVVQITSPRDGGQVNQTPITVSWLVDGVPQSNSQALVPGEQTITREARDSAGKVYSHSIRVTLDQTAPGRPVVKGSTVPVNTLTPTWTWTSGGGGGNGIYRYRLDNPAMSEGVVTTDTFHTAATNLTAGAHTLYVDERDEAGNWSLSGSAQIRIDTTAPAAPTVTVTPSGLTNNRRPTWSWTTGSEAVAQFRFKFGSDDFRGGARDTTGTGHQPAVDLGEGSHTLFVQARDSAGNWSRAGSATVSIDLSGPSAPTVSVASALTNDPTPTWTWSTTTSGAVSFRYRFNNPDLSTGATVTTEKTYTHPTNLGDGTYTVNPR
ncbi:MAG TPA: Ig-like domain-containing protein, partial [Fibrobacteria bacterium]|nr:Ig-like domain-containing protein [Fibrobacteria bacterium]